MPAITASSVRQTVKINNIPWGGENDANSWSRPTKQMAENLFAEEPKFINRHSFINWNAIEKALEPLKPKDRDWIIKHLLYRGEVAKLGGRNSAFAISLQPPLPLGYHPHNVNEHNITYNGVSSAIREYFTHDYKYLLRGVFNLLQVGQKEIEASKKFWRYWFYAKPEAGLSLDVISDTSWAIEFWRSEFNLDLWNDRLRLEESVLSSNQPNARENYNFYNGASLPDEFSPEKDLTFFIAGVGAKNLNKKCCDCCDSINKCNKLYLAEI